MSFQTLEYVLFFVLIVAVYWQLSRRLQNLLLVGASYVFYGFVHPWMVTLLFGYTIVNYFAALGIERHPKSAKHILIAAIASGLGVLGVFKYFDFFVDNVSGLL